MIITIDRKKLKTQDGLLALFLTSFIATRIIEIPVLLANFIPAVCGAFCYLYALLKNRKYSRVSIIISLFFSFFMAVSIIFNNNCDFLDIIWAWSFMGVAVLIYSFKLSSKFVIVQYYIFCIYIIIKMALGGRACEILSIGSENNISVYLLLYFGIYLILMDNEEGYEYINYSHGIVGLFISGWTACRSGILAFFISLAMLYVYNSVKAKKVLNSIIILFVLIVTSCFFFNKIMGSVLLALQAKLNRYGNTSIRIEIWSEYFAAVFTNFYNFFLGPDTSNSRWTWLSHYGGNAHNAFLMLQAHYGIIPFFFVLISVCKGILVLLNKKRYLSIVCLLCVICRSVFDWTAFPGVYDIFFYYTIIVSLTKGINLYSIKDNV